MERLPRPKIDSVLCKKLKQISPLLYSSSDGHPTKGQTLKTPLDQNPTASFTKLQWHQIRKIYNNLQHIQQNLKSFDPLFDFNNNNNNSYFPSSFFNSSATGFMENFSTTFPSGLPRWLIKIIALAPLSIAYFTVGMAATILENVDNKFSFQTLVINETQNNTFINKFEK